MADESGADMCVCHHARDWHGDDGCHAFVAEDGKCECEGFSLAHTAVIHRLAEYLHAEIDAMAGTSSSAVIPTMRFILRHMRVMRDRI